MKRAHAGRWTVPAFLTAAFALSTYGCTSSVAPRKPTATLVVSNATATPASSSTPAAPTPTATSPSGIPTVTPSITPTAYYLIRDPEAYTYNYDLNFYFPQFGFVLQQAFYGVTCYVHVEDSFTLNDLTTCAYTGQNAPTPVNMLPLSGVMTGTMGDLFGQTNPPFTPTPDVVGNLYTITTTSAQGFPFAPQNCTITAVLPIPTITSPSQWAGAQATPGAGSSFTLTWDPMPGATEYQVYLLDLTFSYAGQINGSSSQPWLGTATSVAVSGLSPGNFYLAYVDGHTSLSTLYNDQNLGARFFNFTD